MKTTWSDEIARPAPPVRTPQLLNSILVQVCAFVPMLVGSAESYNQIKSFPAIAFDPSTGAYTNRGGAYPQGPLTVAGDTLYGTT